MNTHIALMVAGTVFGLVSLLQLTRLFLKAEVTFSGKVVPMWASVVGFVVAFSLATWMFMASGG